jgi:hypothetical protein
VLASRVEDAVRERLTDVDDVIVEVKGLEPPTTSERRERP